MAKLWDGDAGARRRSAYKGVHNEFTDLQDICEKWGRNYEEVEDEANRKLDEARRPPHKCVCPKGCNCFICRLIFAVCMVRNLSG